MIYEPVKLSTAKRPLIIAHRGYRAKYPENTLVSFEAALDAGVQMIELDVMLSKDRKVVVFHDATLDRTTNGHGPVSDYTLAELKALDAGSWFDARFAGERIPELEEVLEQLKDRAFVNIEIKSSAYESHQPPDAIERQVVALARHADASASVLISSFETRILENIARIDHAPSMAVLSKYPADRDDLPLCDSVKAFSWHPNCRELKSEQVTRMQKGGLRVFPYNVDSAEEYRRMIQMGVDGVITSDPFIALELNPAAGRTE